MARDIYEDSDEVETSRDGLANGLIILTTLLLVGAFIVMQQALKHHFNEGMFADKTAAGNP